MDALLAAYGSSSSSSERSDDDAPDDDEDDNEAIKTTTQTATALLPALIIADDTKDSQDYLSPKQKQAYFSDTSKVRPVVPSQRLEQVIETLVVSKQQRSGNNSTSNCCCWADQLKQQHGFYNPHLFQAAVEELGLTSMGTNLLILLCEEEEEEEEHYQLPQDQLQVDTWEGMDSLLQREEQARKAQLMQHQQQQQYQS